MRPVAIFLFIQVSNPRVDWGNEVTILNKVLENTISLSREIAIKYINTNKYLYALRPEEATNDANE